MSADRYGAEVETLAHASPRDRAIEYLKNLLAARGLASDPNLTFMELGLRSLDLIALTERIEADLGIDLIPTVFFDYRTTAHLAAHLASAHGARIDGVLRERHIAPACAMPAVVESGGDGDLAIIGMSGRFARSSDVGSLWNRLFAGELLVDQVPETRWRASDFDAADLYCTHGSFIEEFDKFDFEFFGISPREAERMDPQLRLLLEVLYGAAEDAGKVPAFRGSKTGIFVGACYHDYDSEMVQRGGAVQPHDATGTAPSMLSNRPSFVFDLRGPSLTVDTACSSSLVALHLARAALLRDECEMAFVAGVNLILHPRHYLLFSTMRALSKTGRCHSFDAAADGYVPAEAVAAVLLKPLRRAIEDGDPIHAVIKGSAINHVGHTNSVTVPDSAMQAEVLVSAWRSAGIDPSTLGYLEAHGTGTRLGDPIEVEGIKLAFRTFGIGEAPEPFCALGSMKSHMGHAEAAAGLSGLFKTVLSMKHGVLLPMPSFRELNPYIKLEGTPLYVNASVIPWPAREGALRRAGVSSFGFGGANAHVVVEESPPLPAETSSIGPWVFPFSAKRESSLRELATRFVAYFRQEQTASLEAVAFTLQTGREEMPVRLAVVAGTKAELIEALEAYLAGRVATPRVAVGNVDPARAEGMKGEVDSAAAPDALAKAWVRGALDAWPLPSREKAPRRVPLPGYPFARLRAWMDGSAEASEAAPPKAAPPKAVSRDDRPVLRYFEPAWVVRPVGDEGAIQGPIVSFDRDDEDRAALRALVGSGADIVSVRPAAAFRDSGDIVTIDPRAPEDYRRLIAALRGRGWTAARFLFLWAARDRFASPETLLGKLDEVTESGLLAVFHLTKVLLEGAFGAERLVYLYPSGSASRPELVAHHEMVAGFARAAAGVRAGTAWRIVGVDGVLSSGMRELTASDAPTPEEVLYRDGARWTRTVQEIPERAVREAHPMPCEDGGVYLITGGLGGVGYLVAHRFASRGKCALVLTGRSPLDEGVKAKLARLEALGAQAVYLQSDVANLQAAEGCVAYALARFSKLDGVIHAAGVVREQALADKSREEFVQALLPKVRGTLALDQATRAESLSFFVVLSSVSALMPTPFAADYASANRFVDGYMAFRNELRKSGERRGVSLAINYPYWRDGGMRMGDELARQITQATGMLPLPTARGLEVLDAALALASGGRSQIVAAYGDPEKMQRALRAAPASAPMDDGDTADAMGAEVAALVASTLKLRTPVAADADLGQLGFESITIVEFVNALNARWGTGLSPSVFYELGTPAQFARHILRGAPSATREPRPRTTDATDAARDDIAIIGMAGRLPGAEDLTAFWENLAAGRDAVVEASASRLRREGGFIDGVDCFDAAFFDLSPLEAGLMDPQQRLFLQVAWHAIEDAGYSPAALARDITGVFVGVSHVDYIEVLKQAGSATGPTAATGLSLSMIPNRLSYLLDLRGPSEPVDTGCSSALVALHRAITALRAGDCNVAVVGGVNLLLDDGGFAACNAAGMLSPDGRCMTFDARANGYVRGEGVGVVVLKPLERALGDGDAVRAVVKGSGVNHGGRAKGLTVPSPTAQAELLTGIYRRANVDPATLGYIEAHGSGTALGDPIEVRGLTTFFQNFGANAHDGGAKVKHCAIGTVKTNIGHLESAAGMAGLLKVVLAMQHRTLPKNLHFERLNPFIELDESPLFVAAETVAWEPLSDASGSHLPRRAGVSSFGFGGVNAHAIVEEYRSTVRPERVNEGMPERQLIVLSARDGERLRAMVRRLSKALDAIHDIDGGPRLEDIAFTLQVGRKAFEHRLALVVASLGELREKLRDCDEGRTPAGMWSGRVLPGNHALRLLEESAEGLTFLEGLMRKGALSDVARLWVEGAAVPWASLVRGTPRRVPLPGYPFAATRCWVDAGIAEAEKVEVRAEPMADGVLTHVARAVDADRAARGDSLEGSEEGLRMLDALGQTMLLRALRGMGILTEVGVAHGIDALERDLGIEPVYRRLFGALLEILEAGRLVRICDGTVAATERANAPEHCEQAILSSRRRELLDAHPYLAAVLEVLHVAVPEIPAILKGEKDYVSVLFPEGNMSLMEPLYSGSKMSDFYNRLVADGVRRFVEAKLAQTPGRKLHILEVGAGTGGTSRGVVQALKAYGSDVTYVYTDISRKFTHHGIAHFGGQLPDMRFEVLDLEKDTGAQGFEPHGFDLVFGTNVLHATKNIASTLARIHGLLRAGGALMLNELTRTMDFMSLTFGLIKGWWLFQDPELRMKNSPLLDTRQWRRALAAAGFGPVLRLGVSDDDEERVIQNVLLAGVPSGVEARAAGEVDLESALRGFLADVFTTTLKLPKGTLDPKATFAQFGIDSLIAVDLVKRLEVHFGRLPRSLLFERTTLMELASYFAAEHRDAVSSLVGRPSVAVPEMAAPPVEPVVVQERRSASGAMDVAIIGIGGVFPGAANPNALWAHLDAGRDLVREVPKERFDWRPHFGNPRREPHKTNSRWGGFVDDVDKFDPQFFGISPLEAELMDPQQRMFLQVAWKTIEDAGYAPSALKKSNTGVFAAVTSIDYLEVLERAERHDDAFAPSGLARAVLANRISFLLDLHGPSESVDTACSSSLVAVHRAAAAIRAGECDLALAGGVTLLLTPHLFVAFAQAGFMAPDGRCRAFDDRASGFVRGEGAGAVLLKPLERAVADGDTIYGIIKGSGVNHGGEVQSLTVPNPSAQADLIASVYLKAGIDPETVTFIEAHGTGTVLGDPIEVSALKRAFATVRRALGRPEPATQKAYCGIGGIKTNIGHLEAAAGIAGLIKVLLAMRHRRLPKLVHFEKPNPDIDLTGSPFYFLDAPRPWEALRDPHGNDVPRRAGVSSFGFGGVNAHVLVEEWTGARPAQAEAGEQLIVLSAKDDDRLGAYVRELVSYLRDGLASHGVSLADLAYTLQVGRDAMPRRVALLAKDKDELLQKCEAFLQDAHGLEGVWTSAHAVRGNGNVAPHARDGLAALAEAWVSGATPSWSDRHPPGVRRRVPVPTYPFARERYWAEPTHSIEADAAATPEWRDILEGLRRRQLSLEDADRLIRTDTAWG